MAASGFHRSAARRCAQIDAPCAGSYTDYHNAGAVLTSASEVLKHVHWMQLTSENFRLGGLRDFCVTYIDTYRHCVTFAENVDAASR